MTLEKQVRMFSVILEALLSQYSYKVAPTLHRTSIPISKKKPTSQRTFGFYGSHDLDLFIKAILYIATITKEEMRFLDCGCGFGLLPKLVSWVYNDKYHRLNKFHGIDLQKIYVDEARILFGQYDQQSFFKGDLLRFNRYGEYNVLYWWYPISDVDLMKKFTKRAAAQLSTGSFIIANGGLHLNPEEINVKQITRFGAFCIYQKQ